MRIGVLSDTHVPSVCRVMPDAVWRALDGCETVLHAGDFDSWETYCEFKKRFPVFGVIGNRDSFGVSEEVPERRIVELGSFRIGMTHGSGPRAGSVTPTRWGSMTSTVSACSIPVRPPMSARRTVRPSRTSTSRTQSASRFTK
ncbi:MAG: metallophosphoesterase family protein [Candidatus Omnitrophica bacterium]|nr:metallophosphoesterase family protein [Candidatus Omnitrophota bacterium]